MVNGEIKAKRMHEKTSSLNSEEGGEGRGD
jgi:hypothetical protein